MPNVKEHNRKHPKKPLFTYDLGDIQEDKVKEWHILYYLYENEFDNFLYNINKYGWYHSSQEPDSDLEDGEEVFMHQQDRKTIHLSKNKNTVFIMDHNAFGKGATWEGVKNHTQTIEFPNPQNAEEFVMMQITNSIKEKRNLGLER